jgi:hypothetical protein
MIFVLWIPFFKWLLFVTIEPICTNWHLILQGMRYESSFYLMLCCVSTCIIILFKEKNLLTIILDKLHPSWLGCLSRHVSPPTHQSKTAVAAAEDHSHLELWRHLLLGRLSSDLALHPALHPTVEAHCFSSGPPEGLTPLARSSCILRHRLFTLPTHPARNNDTFVHGLGLDSGTRALPRTRFSVALYLWEPALSGNKGITMLAW